MEITEVKVFPISEEKLKAFVSVVFDGCFMVNDIKIICGREGLFISMPSRKKKNGEFKDVAHPLNNDTRRMIEAQVLEEYERVLAERSPRGELAEPPVARPLPPDRPEPAPQPRAAKPAATEPGAPPAVAPPAVAPPAETPRPAAAASSEKPSSSETPEEQTAGKREKTLEEVEELHLRDSFWTVS